MDPQNGNATDSPFNRPLLFGVIGAICGLWLIGCMISTRCCRRLGSENSRYTRGVWAVGTPTQEQEDAAIARELQEAEVRAALSPEEVEAAQRHYEEKKRAREAFVEKVLPGGDSFNPSDVLQSDECVVCLADFTSGDNITTGTTGRCCHVFHRQCISEWLVHKGGCPVCREVLLKEDLPKDGVDDSPNTVLSGDEEVGSMNGSRDPPTSEELSSPDIVLSGDEEMGSAHESSNSLTNEELNSPDLVLSGAEETGSMKERRDSPTSEELDSPNTVLSGDEEPGSINESRDRPTSEESNV